MPIKGHIISNYNIKLDVFLKTEYIKIKKMSKNKKDFIPSHKKISISCTKTNKILHIWNIQGKRQTKEKHHNP